MGERRNILIWFLLLLSLLIAATSRAQAGSSAASDPRRVALAETRDPESHPLRRRGLIARRDRKRLRRPIAVPIFGRELLVSGRLTLDNRTLVDNLRDFDLVATDSGDVDNDGNTIELKDRARGRIPLGDRISLAQRLEVDFFYTFTDRSAIYFENEFSYAQLVYADVEPEVERWTLQRKEAWLYFGNLFDSPVGIQLGAQRFSDDREWWWDENLDAFRVRLDRPTIQAEISVARQLLAQKWGESRVDAEDDEIIRVLGQAEWKWAKNQALSFYFLHHDDQSDGYTTGSCFRIPGGAITPPIFLAGCIDPDREDESDARLTWFGGGAAGRLLLPDPMGRAHYWLDVSGVVGKETFYELSGPNEFRRANSRNRHSVRGFGLDLGVTWEPALPLIRPSFTVGYAFASSRGQETETRQRGFRQTGLQDNTDKFRGVATFNYYGELFDPELANLEIWTFGFGFRFFRQSSLDVVYHIYRQDVASELLRDVGFKRDPFGTNKNLGEEVDVILGIEEWERLEIKAVFAMFRTAQAFSPGDDKNSFLGQIRFRMNF